ncbi:radical SAM protein [Candidatus Omnitrophota bacterium]
MREVWNSPAAQKFRASILDGSFRYCIEGNCYFLTREEEVPLWWEKNGTPYRNADEITDPRLREIIENNMTVLNDGPFTLTCGYDSTCNLLCPSCRRGKKDASKEDIERKLVFQERIFSEIGKDLRLLYISGVGDPFASPVYQKLLQSLSAEDYPNLEIHLGTNGLLWTREKWEAMKGIHERIATADISIDAASPETYPKNRPGGNWQTLMENLEFISELRKKGPLRFVMTNFLVQQNNYREMPAFIELTERFGFDLAHLLKMRNWGSLSIPEYKKRSVNQPLHPEHSAFLKLLCQDCFECPVALFTCLHKIRLKALAIQKSGTAGFQRLEMTTKPLRFLDSIYMSLYYALRFVYRKIKKLFHVTK